MTRVASTEPCSIELRLATGACALLLATSCVVAEPEDLDAAEDSLIANPLEEFPSTLEEVGLYPDASDPDVVVNQAFAYEPDWPLWSNGLGKRRYIVVPAGGAVYNSSAGDWEFSEGTLLFKTFLDGERPIETRVMRFDGQEWDFAAYQWDAKARTAELLDGRRFTAVPLEAKTGESFEHEIPATDECRQCHESNSNAVLGFAPLQFDSDRGQRLLRDAKDADVISREPRIDGTVDAISPWARDVVGYFVGNCIHCHNGGSGLASSFDLSPSVAVGNIVNRETESSASAVGIRVVPGQPEESILFLAVSGEGSDPEIKQMPPLGVQLRDAEAIEMLREWITQLTP